MKFTIDKNTILDALNSVVKALSQKITIPASKRIKLRAGKDFKASINGK